MWVRVWVCLALCALIQLTSCVLRSENMGSLEHDEYPHYVAVLINNVRLPQYSLSTHTHTHTHTQLLQFPQREREHQLTYQQPRGGSVGVIQRLHWTRHERLCRELWVEEHGVSHIRICL